MKRKNLLLVLSFLFGILIVSPLILAGPTALNKMILLDAKKFLAATGLRVFSVDFAKQSLGDAIEDADDKELESCFQTMIETYPELGNTPASAGYFVWEGKKNYCMRCGNTKLRIKFETVPVNKSLMEKIEMTDKTSFLHKFVDALVPVAFAGPFNSSPSCENTPGFEQPPYCNPPKSDSPVLPVSAIVGGFLQFVSSNGLDPYTGHGNEGGSGGNDDSCGADQPGEGQDPNYGDA